MKLVSELKSCKKNHQTLGQQKYFICNSSENLCFETALLHDPFGESHSTFGNPETTRDYMKGGPLFC